jgi:hypothetical protein
MAEKKYILKYNGRPLTNYLINFVTEVAKIKKIDVSTDKKLFDFYQKNKDIFEDTFEIGVESFPEGTPKTIRDLSKAANIGKTFYIEKGGKTKQVSFEEAIYEITKTEMTLNEMLDTTGFVISYRATYDGKIYIRIPTENEIEELEGLEDEDLNDSLDEYGIKVFTSDPKVAKNKTITKKRKKYYKNIVYLNREISEIYKKDKKNESKNE